MAENRPDKPDYLQFYPTLRCNSDCHFCFNKDVAFRDDVRFEDFERLASVAAQRGIGHIDFLGGEPTLHPELRGLVENLASRGIRITLSSNGTDLEQLATLMDNYGAATLTVGLSLNDAVLPGSFDRFISSRRPLVKSVFSMNRLIPAAAQTCAAHPEIDYFLIYRDAVDEQDLRESVPFHDFFPAIQRLKNAYPRFEGVFCQGFTPDTKAHPGLADVRCPAGSTKLSVLPDGAVYPCYLFFGYPEFELGNIVTDAFPDIWKHPTLDFFRKFKENRCPKTDCGLFAFCHGGCPAMSYRFYGDLAGPDPRCMPPDGHSPPTRLHGLAYCRR